MKLLLTSAGIKNPSIEGALVGMLEKPISESAALCIPTAGYAMRGGAARAREFIAGTASTPMCELGWKSLGVLELTALPGIPTGHWIPTVQEADVLLVNGGDALYLAHWMRQSGLSEMLPSLQAVYVGLSGGSMAMSPQVGEEFMGYGWDPPDGLDEGLGLVDFSIFPHLDHEDLPDNNMANAEIWAAGIKVPGYVIDDQTAIKVDDGELEVISEGNWQLLTP
jgi:dipeptidase E